MSDSTGGYPRGGRPGFTLIEILIVMVILLILAGLLLGATILVRNRVTAAQQSAELTQIDLALNKFKQQYGFYPPSRIRLREWKANGDTTVFTAGSASLPAVAYALDDPFDAHSVAYLRRLWPNIRLPITQTAGGTLIETPTESIRWYADQTPTGTNEPQVYDLEGDQCLVFFLGGVAQRIGQNQFVMHGFTDDGTNPSRIPDGQLPRTITRVAPLYDFDAARLYVRGDPTTSDALVDIAPRLAEVTVGGTQDFYPATGYDWAVQGRLRLGRLPAYRSLGSDTARPMPIAYFSSYDGRGYRPDDLNIPPGPTVIAGDAFIPFQLVWPRLTQQPNNPASLGPNPYTRTLANPAGSQVLQAYNPQGFQLILPGPDNEFGAGGSQRDYGGASVAWSYNVDNQTNFSAGKGMGDFVQSQQGTQQ